MMKTKGFTLIELLIVMFIIAIIITVAILALGDMGKSRQAKYFANTLKTQLAYAEETAIVQPSVLLFQLKPKHYQFSELKMTAHNDGSLSYRWVTLPNFAGTNGHIPSFVTLSFENHLSQVSIRPNGTLTPFQLKIAIARENTYYLLSATASGMLRLSKHTGGDA